MQALPKNDNVYKQKIKKMDSFVEWIQRYCWTSKISKDVMKESENGTAALLPRKNG